ncbi:tetracycline resistance protein [Fusarium pseudoanthophilum]|uniref:Tetracycline resistance protein n=1 Tax=Fusarium pseudoanthophilum TaxID=48495 RepID=A0A8H5NRZ0_9HYPO|nr:tetracycline resistance protein [Fusarium pseudoanthophilum]
MAASSFHPFPRLPTELRLQIWTAACLCHRPSDYRIHYTDVEPTSTEGTLPPSYAFTACLADGDNDSACLTNGGLWKACKESRDVMIQHSRIDGHRCAKNGILGNTEDWYLPVCARHDIFCIKSKTLNTPDDHDEAWQIQIPGLSPKGSQMMDINNIAFEFDETWNRDMPKSYYDLMWEKSARGFLSCFLYNKSRHVKTTPNIWIILKNSQWALDHRRGSGSARHGYDTEYVQMIPQFSSRLCLGTRDFDGVLENAKTFIRTLEDLYEANENEYGNVSWSPFQFYDIFKISQNFLFLALRRRHMQNDFSTDRAG